MDIGGWTDKVTNGKMDTRTAHRVGRPLRDSVAGRLMRLDLGCEAGRPVGDRLMAGLGPTSLIAINVFQPPHRSTPPIYRACTRTLRVS